MTKNVKANWIDNLSPLFNTELKFIKKELELEHKHFERLPKEGDFIEYILTGMDTYFAEYNFHDTNYMKHLTRYFICNFIIPFDSIEKGEVMAQVIINFNVERYNVILDNALKIISPNKKLDEVLNKGRTYDYRLFQLASNIHDETGLKLSKCLLGANKEHNFFDEALLLDKNGKMTLYFQYMIDAFYRYRARNKSK